MQLDDGVIKNRLGGFTTWMRRGGWSKYSTIVVVTAKPKPRSGFLAVCWISSTTWGFRPNDLSMLAVIYPVNLFQNIDVFFIR